MIVKIMDFFLSGIKTTLAITKPTIATVSRLNRIAGTIPRFIPTIKVPPKMYAPSVIILSWLKFRTPEAFQISVYSIPTSA